MKSLGGYLLFFGIGSMILHLMQREFIILSWVDTWGPTVGWSIRIAMTVIGAALFFLGGKKTEPTA